MITKISLFLMWPLLFSANCRVVDKEARNTANFELSLDLEDGESETYVHYRGRWAKVLQVDQTQVASIRLHQVTNGKVLVHNIYNSDNQLVDCDIVSSEEDIENFIHEFQAAVMPKLRDLDILIPDKTKFGYLDVQNGHNHELLQVRPAKHACKNFHKEMTRRKQNEGTSESTSRSKRSVLISPGTQWCGAGSKAKYAKHFGSSSKTDRCCMEHDGCPYFIEGLTNKYGYFNYRFYTLSYCDCDLRFFECLKNTGSSTAKTIGKVFFNVVNRNCFRLKRERVCAKRSWWGYCNKWKSGLVAVVHETPMF